MSDNIFWMISNNFGDALNPYIYEKITEQRGWVDYINENSVPELITFGEEYLR